MFSRMKPFVVITAGCALLLSLQGCEKINDLKSRYFAKDKPVKKSPATRKSEKPPVLQKSTLASSKNKKTDQKAPSGDVVAQVGEWSITESEFQERLQALQKLVPDFNPEDEESAKVIMQELVNQELLYQEAKRLNVGGKEEIASQMEQFQESVRIQQEELERRLFVQEMAQRTIDAVVVSDEDVQKYYDDNKKALIEPYQYKLREIVLEDEAAAKDILAQIYQGTPFTDLVSQSTAQSAWNKGDMGFVTQFPFPKMRNVVEVLDVGGVSSVFQGPEGFYVVMLEDKKGGEPQAFEDIKEDIKEGLTLLRQREALLQHLEELRGKTPVQIKEKYLLEE